MRVNRTLTSHGETLVGEIELYPVAIRATGDKELNAQSAELRAPGQEIEETKAGHVALQAERPRSPDTTWVW